MDFFQEQDRARRSSRWFLAGYLIAAAGVMASYCLAAALLYAFFATAGALPVAGEAPLVWRGLGATYLEALTRVPAAFHGAIAAIVGGCILAVSAYRIWQLREGGPSIAYLLGAKYVDAAAGASPSERRLLNVVEEMAIASGIAVPPVYVLAREDGVNALVAGYSPNEAVVIVTRGAMEKLSRDELQGVMAHEFSHILNGDMALNVYLAGLLGGLSWLGTKGEEMFFAAAWTTRHLSREERGAEAFTAVFGALLALVGFPGSLAADAIKARISREREFLADAASVQFTRNPEGIAGALDSILSLPAHTAVSALHRGEFSHMFFAPAVSRWWGFPTHPSIDERIRRADPRFMRDEYRATRYGRQREVAVLDGLGNVVKHVRELGQAAVGRPSAREVDFAARLVARLPQSLCEALHEADGAELAMFALAIGPTQYEAATALIAKLRGEACVARTADLHITVGALARHHMLTLAEIAVPAIKSQPQAGRDRFLADLTLLVHADQRVTLREFVLLTFLRQRLREGAGLPIRTQYRSIEEIAPDAHAALSLVAHAARDGARQAFDKGAAVLKLGWKAPLPPQALTSTLLSAALERLRHLEPFAKPALLRACLEAAAADGQVTLAEGELVRMVAATLDCPLPPLLAAQDPLSLAA